MMSIQEEKTLEFKHHYDTNQTYYHAALAFFLKLIGNMKGIEFISGRVKDYDECLSKFKRKYLPEISSANTDYHIIDYLSDFIGIRAVCYYLEDVISIRKELNKFFREVSITDKTIQLEKTADKFGYKSLHLDLTLKNKNKSPDFIKYSNVQFEIQIRTVIQDAWSILDHKIKYKKSIPQNLKRRINRLSALFEIADDEFLRIKKEITIAEKQLEDRLKRGDSLEKDVPIDVFRFLFIALKHFPGFNFVEFKVDGFVQEILDLDKLFSESDLNDVLVTYLDKVATLLPQNEIKQLNPYTKIRYCLYLSDHERFSSMLTVYQKNNISRRN